MPLPEPKQQQRGNLEKLEENITGLTSRDKINKREKTGKTIIAKLGFRNNLSTIEEDAKHSFH